MTPSPRPWLETLALITLLVASAPAQAVAPDETDPVKIMTAVDERDNGDKAKARMQMVITDRSGSQRTRVVRTQGLDFPGGTKQLILFESPADVRNTGLLTVDYDAGDKVDDQWLYLPSLRKSTRISSSSKSGAFMGSDLSFSDMTRQSPDQYDYTMVDAAATARGEDCWLIEARPKTAKAKDETGYLKSLLWVSKAKLMPVQVKHWVREGKKLKFLVFSGIKQVDGVWVAHKISAKTVQAKETLSTTVISFANMSFNNADVVDSAFTQRRLEQGL